MNACVESCVPEFADLLPVHVAEIGELERRNYEFPWSDGIFRDCVKAGYVCRRVLLNGHLVGYGILQAAADEAHILNLCIDQQFQHRGLGRALLDHLTTRSADLGARIVFLEVRPSNPRAKAMYLAAGFNEVGVRPNYYDARGGREDAIVMARSMALTSL